MSLSPVRRPRRLHFLVLGPGQSNRPSVALLLSDAAGRQGFSVAAYYERSLGRLRPPVLSLARTSDSALPAEHAPGLVAGGPTTGVVCLQHRTGRLLPGSKPTHGGQSGALLSQPQGLPRDTASVRNSLTPGTSTCRLTATTSRAPTQPPSHPASSSSTTAPRRRDLRRFQADLRRQVTLVLAGSWLPASTSGAKERL